MKRFEELTGEEFKNVVENSKMLREKLSERILENEMSWLDEKLGCFNSKVADWSIGAWNNNFFEAVENSDIYQTEYISCIEDSTKTFGCSEKMERMIEHCKKLYCTNLFMYHVKKMYELYYKEELKPAIDYIEKASCDIDNCDLDEYVDELDLFQDNYSDWLYDEEENEIYEPHRLAI